MGWQTDAVRRVVESAGPEFAGLPVEPVLYFVDSDWPLLSSPNVYKGVRLESTRSIRNLVIRAQWLDSPSVDRLTRILALAFPSK
jgi:hypothetical protein